MIRKKRIFSAASFALVLVLALGIFAGCGSNTSTSSSTNIKGTGGGMGSQGNADTSAINKKYLDVAYASKSAAQKLDIYIPNSGTAPFPVVIQIHGGAFMSGDKASGELTPVLSALDRGYAVVSVNYRLSGEAKFPAQINDVKAAIRYIRANAAKYNLNADKIAVWGGSAGGSLAALAGTSGDVAALQDDSLGNAGISNKVEAVVDWFGPINFSTMDEEFKALGTSGAMGSTSSASSPESTLLGKTVGTTEAEALVKATSAATYITSDDPAFFIEHGTADRNVPYTQSVNLSEALKKVIGSDKVTITLINGAGHGTSEFTTSENVTKVLDFLDKTLK